MLKLFLCIPFWLACLSGSLSVFLFGPVKVPCVLFGKLEQLGSHSDWLSELSKSEAVVPSKPYHFRAWHCELVFSLFFFPLKSHSNKLPLVTSGDGLCFSLKRFKSGVRSVILGVTSPFFPGILLSRNHKKNPGEMAGF